MKKTILTIITIILVLALAAALVLCFTPKLQLRTMTAIAMTAVKNYDFTKFTDEDPVLNALEDAFDDNMPLSAQALYDYLKDNAADMSWTIASADPSARKTELDITYTDATPFLSEYAVLLADEFIQEADDGEATINDSERIFDIIGDERNAELIRQAAKNTPEQFTTSRGAISFERKAFIYIPSGVDEGVYDAVASGLYSISGSLEDTVRGEAAVHVVEKLLDMVKAFDLESFEDVTGADLSMVTTLAGTSNLGSAVVDFLAECEAQVDYTIEHETASPIITVNCEYCDGSAIPSAFIGNAISDQLSRLLDDDESEISFADIFRETVSEAGALPRVTGSFTVDISDPDGVKIDGDIYNIFTANMYSMLSDVLSLIS